MTKHTWIVLSTVFIATLTTTAYAAVTALGTTTISFSAFGHPNSIPGTWTAQVLDIREGDTVEYFLLEVQSFTASTTGLDGFSFTDLIPADARSLSFGSLCPAGNSCVGLAFPGSISSLNVATTAQWMARDFLFRLDPDNPQHISHGSAIVSFIHGGDAANAEGLIKVTAYGESALVPESSSLTFLFLAVGIGALLCVRKMIRIS